MRTEDIPERSLASGKAGRASSLGRWRFAASWGRQETEAPTSDVISDTVTWLDNSGSRFLPEAG